MAKSRTDKKLTSAQRQARTYRIIFVAISIIIILTFVLSLIK
jgi:predicted nucleic acid-binding Zn ribbon protein